MQHAKPNRERDLETILVLCVALVVIYFFTKQQHNWLLKLSIVLGITGMMSKYLAAKISWAWLKLGELISLVMGKVILTIIFYVFLFPVALLARVFSKGKDSLQLNKSSSDSYYFTRNHKYVPKDLENVW